MSAYFIVFMVLFSSTPEGLPQMTLLQRYGDVRDCKKALDRLKLEDKQKEDLGCVRVVRGSAKLTEV